MARNSGRAADSSKEVTLVGPTGDEITTGDPTSIQNLIYGMGYKTKTGTNEEAVAALQEQAASD